MIAFVALSFLIVFTDAFFVPSNNGISSPQHPKPTSSSGVVVDQDHHHNHQQQLNYAQITEELPPSSTLFVEDLLLRDEGMLLSNSRTFFDSHHHQNDDDSSPVVKLSQLSSNPLLFVSSSSSSSSSASASDDDEPLLSSNECQILQSWCQNNLIPNESVPSRLWSNHNEYADDNNNNDEGLKILTKLKRVIDEIVGHTKVDDSALTVRYISYDSSDHDMEQRCHPSSSTTTNKPLPTTTYELLPDGLHVDTNNGQHFRHWTVLFYLNCCYESGATTFPLATRIDVDPSSSHDAFSSSYSPAHQAAEAIILQEKQLHTRVASNVDVLKLGQQVEDVALKLRHDDNVDNNFGLRLLPKEGHCCIFSSLTKDGYSNPYSIHGGEVLQYGETKDVLTFFYEVPYSTATPISSHEELGEQVQQRELEFLQRHKQRHHHHNWNIAMNR